MLPVLVRLPKSDSRASTAPLKNALYGGIHKQLMEHCLRDAQVGIAAL